ncbi:MAG: hypothetical protein CVV07_01010 [Gammaproteobacteria bacterium HGW-Gammaproteobacteria-11]|nr:MAG: hypothetical protein CVV07_01010 [Gammaproteobacteria bacterium HGW-Gammaproteobacteria-11]
MGSSSSSQTVGYRYYFDIHMGLGLPLDEMVEIRASDKRAWRGSVTSNQQIVINAPKLFGGDDGEGGLQGTLDVLFGEEDQGILPKLASMLGGVVPAFRGITTAFYSGLVTSMNPYPKPWEILRRGGNRLWDAEGAWYPEKQFIWLADGEIKAMNPVHILYLIRTGSRFRGWPREWMDDAAWRAAADTCFDEQLGLCLEWTRSDSFQTFSSAVTNHISAEIFDDRRTGLIKIRLMRDDYDPEALPLFDENSGLLEVVEDDNTSNDESPSELFVKYTDAIDGKKKTVRAVNSAVAARDRGRASETIEYPGAPTAQIASRLAARDMRIRTSGLKRFKIVLDRRARDLEPGQPFRIRSLRRGIDIVVLRAGKIKDGTLLDGRIEITAVQDVFGLPATSYVSVPPAGWAPPDRTPAPVAVRQVFELPYRDISAITDPANLALIDVTAAYFGAVGTSPTTMAIGYRLATRVGASGEFVDRGGAGWCPSAQLSADIGRLQTVVQLTGMTRADEVAIGSAALLGSEVVRIDALDIDTGIATIGRGCADTTPAAHSADTRIWFYEQNAAVDDTAYSMGTGMQAKMLTVTTAGELGPDLAPIDSITLQARQGKPYPPGRLRINDNENPASAVSPVTLSWSHRDRVSQSDQLIDTTIGNIGPEPGTSYTARLLRSDTLAVLDIESGISGTSVVLESAYAGEVIVEVWSVRDGIVSWQRLSHSFTLTI